MPTLETSGIIFLKPNALLPSGPAEVNTRERRAPGRGAFATEKPRNDPRATSERAPGGEQHNKGTAHGRGKELAVERTPTHPAAPGPPQDPESRPPGKRGHRMFTQTQVLGKRQMQGGASVWGQGRTARVG